MSEEEYDVGDGVSPEFSFFLDGEPADPTSVLVTVLRGDGALMTPPPRRDALGVWSIDLIFDVAGTWAVHAVGSGAGVDAAVDYVYFVTPPATEGTPAHYGASFGGVQALLPGRRITDKTPTTPSDVRGFLATIGHQVAARIRGRLGELEVLAGAAEGLHFRQAARGLVQLGAAAMVEDAGFPERAGVDATDTSYGAVLWARYREGLDGLVASIDGEIERRRAKARQLDASPGISSPEPTFRLDTRF